jgi:GGDEF domain-containing protein
MIDGLSHLIFNIYEAFTVAFFLRHETSLRCYSSVSFAKSFDKSRDIPLEGTLPGWVIKHNEPLIIPNFDKDENTLGYYGGPEGIKSFIGYPMDATGVLIVDSKKKWSFPDKEKRILGDFVALIQAELDKEKKSQVMEEKFEELLLEKRMVGLCNEVNGSRHIAREILRECLSFSGADGAFVGIETKDVIYVAEAYGKTLEGLEGKGYPQGQSIASMIIEGGRELLLPYNSRFLREKPLLTPEEAIKTKQLFGFPLVDGDTAFGILGFLSSTDRPLKEHAITLLRDAATLLSLYYKAQWLKENLRRTRDIEPLTKTVQFSLFLTMVEAAHKAGNRFSIVSVLLPDIAEHNRTLGLQLTNDLLVHAAGVIRFCAGTQAVVSRKSGGHFYTLLRNTAASDAQNAAKMMHYSIIKSINKDTGTDKRDTVKSGVAHFPEDSRNMWELLAIAEKKHSYKS